MANFTTKTIKEIFDSFISKYTALRIKHGDTAPLLEKSFVKSLGYAISGEVGTLWQLSVWVYKQCFPQTCNLPALKLWGSLIGINYNDGQTANLTIELTNVSAKYLGTGTVYKDLKSGLIFKTLSQVNAEDEKISTTVQCSTPGPIGNLSVGTVLNIANPLDGIPSMATVTAVKIEGTDDEEVETYRKRVLYGFQKKSEIGSPFDYYTWALSVPGIVDAFPYILNEGIITLYLVANGSGKERTPSGTITPNPFPEWLDGNFQEFEGEGQFLQVAQAIEGSEVGTHNRRPVMARVKLEAPIYTPFDVEIGGLSDISYNDAIKNALANVLDKKKPHIVVLDYPLTNAKINLPQLSAACTEAVESESFTSIYLKNEAGEKINEATLGIGCLAYLRKLTINGEVYYNAEE